MLAHPGYDNIPIEEVYFEILQKFMLAPCVFVTSSLTIVFLKLSANIQC